MRRGTLCQRLRDRERKSARCRLMRLTPELRLMEKYGFLWFGPLWKPPSKGSELSSETQVAGNTCFTSLISFRLGSPLLPPFCSEQMDKQIFHMSQFSLREEVWNHLLANDALQWLPYPLLYSLLFFFFSLLFQLIIMTASSTQLFCSTLIIFFPQDIWGIRSRPEKSDRQEFILFIVILNLGFCHFPPPKEREANGIPFWKGIKNRHKYATLQDSSPQISSHPGALCN